MLHVHIGAVHLSVMQTSRPTSASGEDDDEDADRSEPSSDDGRVSA